MSRQSEKVSRVPLDPDWVSESKVLDRLLVRLILIFLPSGWKPVRLKSAILFHFMGGALCPQVMREIVSGWIWNWCLQTVGPSSVEVGVCLLNLRR